MPCKESVLHQGRDYSTSNGLPNGSTNFRIFEDVLITKLEEYLESTTKNTFAVPSNIYIASWRVPVTSYSSAPYAPLNDCPSLHQPSFHHYGTMTDVMEECDRFFSRKKKYYLQKHKNFPGRVEKMTIYRRNGGVGRKFHGIDCSSTGHSR